MTDDNKTEQPDFNVLLASFQQQFETKLAEQATTLKKEFEIAANKIHSSYASKLKKAGISEDEDDKPATSKSSAKQAELEALVRQSNENIEKLMTSLTEKDKVIEQKENEKLLLTHKGSVVGELVKNGFNTVQAEAVYKLQNVDNAFVPDGKGGFNWKVKANGLDVALPVQEATKHFLKSDLAETFLPAKTLGGGTKTPNPTDGSSSKDSSTGNRRLPKVSVDWTAVNHDMHGGSGDGTTAPPFETGKRY